MSLFKLSVRNMLGAVVLLGMSTTHAAAVDMTGTWEGKAKCKGFFNGAKVKDTFEAPVTITQTGSDLNMEFFGVRYNGGIIDDAANPEKGQGSFVACETAAEPLANYNETGHVTVQITSKKSTFKATSVFTTAVGGSIVTVETCKWTFKRIDPTNPGVPSCL
jgi:hypothetical protein